MRNKILSCGNSALGKLIMFSNFMYPKMKTPKPNDLVESKLRGHNKHCRLQRNCRGNVAVVYHIFCFFNRLNPVEGFQKSSCPDHYDAF